MDLSLTACNPYQKYNFFLLVLLIVYAKTQNTIRKVNLLMHPPNPNMRRRRQRSGSEYNSVDLNSKRKPNNVYHPLWSILHDFDSLHDSGTAARLVETTRLPVETI